MKIVIGGKVRMIKDLRHLGEFVDKEVEKTEKELAKLRERLRYLNRYRIQLLKLVGKYQVKKRDEVGSGGVVDINKEQ